MTNDITETARDLAERFGSRMCDEHGETYGEELYAMGVDDIIDIIKLVAAAEREACAKVCYELPWKDMTQIPSNLAFAAAIRARGEP